MATRKVVVKVGTSSLIQGEGLSRRMVLGFVRQLVELHDQGVYVVVVSSGAVALGRELLSGGATKQAAASMGQVRLMQVWVELFSIFDLRVGQMLLTRGDLSSGEGRANTRDTLMNLLEYKVIPIVNENDVVGTKETRIGDNDNLAALVAEVIGADLIILLTDQEGLFTADPRKDPDAKLVSIVREIDEHVFALAGGSSTEFGTGGMVTKIEAARKASKSGVRTIIAPFFRPNVLIDLIRGEQIGTVFQGEVRE